MNLLLKKISVSILISNLLAYIPEQLELSRPNKLAKNNYTQSDRIASNTIIDITMLNDSLYLFGTAGGLSHAEIISYDSIYWGYFIYLPKLEHGFQQADRFKEIFSHIGKVIC